VAGGRRDLARAIPVHPASSPPRKNLDPLMCNYAACNYTLVSLVITGSCNYRRVFVITGDGRFFAL
jgi:hypothetical protein